MQQCRHASALLTRAASGARAVDVQLLVQCVAPSCETSKRVAQRQDFAARSISSLAGPDGDPVAKEVPDFPK